LFSDANVVNSAVDVYKNLHSNDIFKKKHHSCCTNETTSGRNGTNCGNDRRSKHYKSTTGGWMLFDHQADQQSFQQKHLGRISCTQNSNMHVAITQEQQGKWASEILMQLCKALHNEKRPQIKTLVIPLLLSHQDNSDHVCTYSPLFDYSSHNKDVGKCKQVLKDLVKGQGDVSRCLWMTSSWWLVLRISLEMLLPSYLRTLVASSSKCKIDSKIGPVMMDSLTSSTSNQKEQRL
ncbi:hypothetical protein HPG69_000897, partial [Diceros bicornis minor]